MSNKEINEYYTKYDGYPSINTVSEQFNKESQEIINILSESNRKYQAMIEINEMYSNPLIGNNVKYIANTLNRKVSKVKEILEQSNEIYTRKPVTSQIAVTNQWVAPEIGILHADIFFYQTKGKKSYENPVLIVVDVYSRYTWIRKLTKTKSNIKQAMIDIICDIRLKQGKSINLYHQYERRKELIVEKEGKTIIKTVTDYIDNKEMVKPTKDDGNNINDISIKIVTDSGTEFKGLDKGYPYIEHIYSRSIYKAAIAESFVMRTRRQMRTQKGEYNFEAIAFNLNHINPPISRKDPTPFEIYHFNKKPQLDILRQPNTTKITFTKGDIVRIKTNDKSLIGAFGKYSQTMEFSTDFYRIIEIQKYQNIQRYIVCKIPTELNVNEKRHFYNEELRLVDIRFLQKYL